MSLDGYIAPPGMGLTNPDKAALDAWLAQWSQLQDWVFHQEFFRKNLHHPTGEKQETTTNSCAKSSIAPARQS